MLGVGDGVMVGVSVEVGSGVIVDVSVLVGMFVGETVSVTVAEGIGSVAITSGVTASLGLHPIDPMHIAKRIKTRLGIYFLLCIISSVNKPH